MKSIAENAVDGALAAAIVVLVVALGLMSLTAAEEGSSAVPRHLPLIVDVRDVQPEDEQVSGVLVNLSVKPVRGVRVRIDRSWVWADAGQGEEIPAGTAVFAVPGEIAPGERWPFTHRSDALPQRSDGHFETSVSVVGLEEVG